MTTSALDLEKRALRRAMRELAPEPDALARRRASERVAEAVVASAEFAAAARVALYAPLQRELDTRSLFDAIVAAGKGAFFPRCVGDSLEFARVDEWDALVGGAFGTREPPQTGSAEGLDAGDLALVPGLAFDRRGGRLGRGRGYYDRAFGSGRVPFLCGVAYAAQLVERVPTGSFDVTMNALVTEKGWLRVGPARDTGSGEA